MLMRQNMFARIDKSLSRRIVRYRLYGLIVVLAVLALVSLNAPTVLTDDAFFYYRYGQDIAYGDYVLIASSFRTYGYPVFVALCMHLAWLVNLPDFTVVIVVQFFLHIAAAMTASRLARALLETTFRPWMSVFVFALVALNPYLLSMTTQILSDSISVMALTAFALFLYKAFNSRSMKYCIACGVTFGLCYVLRPFHLVWGIGVLAGGVLLYAPMLWSRALSSYHRRTAIRRTLYISFAALLMIASQFLFTWAVQSPYGGTLETSFRTIMDNSAVLTHRLGAVYYYRYETFGSTEALAGEPTGRTIQYYSRTLKANPAHPQRFVLPFIKAASLFQQHEYATYRTSPGIISPAPFAVGLVLWAMYCYALPKALWDVWQAFRLRQIVPLRALLVYAISLYIALYALPTIPEPRYISPIYAILTVIACVYAAQETRWWPLVLSTAVALVTYLLTAHALLEFVLVGYPLFS